MNDIERTFALQLCQIDEEFIRMLDLQKRIDLSESKIDVSNIMSKIGRLNIIFDTMINQMKPDIEFIIKQIVESISNIDFCFRLLKDHNNDTSATKDEILSLNRYRNFLVSMNSRCAEIA